MATSIRMPSLGASMTEGVVARWLKRKGEWVEEGEPVVEVETDKVVYEVESPAGGFLHPVVPEERAAPVGGLVGYLLSPGEEPPATVAIEEAVTRPKPPLAERAAPAYEVVPMRGVRRVVSDNMLRSLQQTALYTICLDADVTELVDRRRRLFEGASKLRVSFIDIVIKAVAEVLGRHPRLNAVVEDGEIRVLRDINIGFAVALDEGVLVPVVCNADRKSLAEIARTTRGLARRARENKLTLDDIQGGTFTVTAPGFVDVCTPILNYPECAILGVGRIAEKPALYQGQIVPRSITVLSLSLDHRAVDGAPAAAFLRRLQQLLERPEPLFAGVQPQQ